jgi:anti-sigma factor RsiW
MMHISDNEEALLDYLYEEGDPAERLKIGRHLQDCATCSVAVIELRSVRGLLSEWTPPPAALGFKIVREMPGIGSRLGALWPRWAQVAAGMFLFAAGMGFSQLHFEYGSGALTVRTGSAPSSAVASIQPAHVGSDIPLPAAPVSVSEPSRSASADEVLQRVKTLIDQSESRQQRELALRLAQVVNDFDAQRRADLLRVDQNFGQLEGQTGAEVARQRDLLNRVLVSGQGK